MERHRIFTTSFASVYPHLVRKVERKGRAKEEVDQVICWLTGYSPEALAEQIARKTDFETFFAEAPALHPNVGFEQTLLGRALAVRAGLDETSFGGGVTVRRRPLQLDVAYVRDLGKARLGDLFGETSNSILATLTFDMTWLAAPHPIAGAETEHH